MRIREAGLMGCWICWLVLAKRHFLPAAIKVVIPVSAAGMLVMMLLMAMSVWVLRPSTRSAPRPSRLGKGWIGVGCVGARLAAR